MNARLQKHQRDKIRQFVVFTNTTDDIALQYLSSCNFNLEQACDRFYQHPPVLKTSRSVNAIEELFNRYANDPSDQIADTIGPHGMLKLLTDLNIDPSDRKALILAWKLNASVQCEFKKTEWISGLSALRIDSLDGLRNYMRQADSIVADVASFRSFYQFTFNYAKPALSRGLALETAVAYWRVVFGENLRVEQWIEFLESQNRGITRDEWNLFFDFLHSTKPDLSDYDSEGAWPVRIDEFVEHVRSSAPGQQRIEPMEQ